jgi:exopolysaccharide biosynthesis protein
MTRRLTWLFLLILAACTVAPAEVKVTSWSPAYVGIDQATGSIDGKDASVVYAMRIHLKARGISFVVTPHSGAMDTVSDTITNFAKKNHVQVAINTGFFTPCCHLFQEDKNILGLSISEGKIVSSPSTDGKYIVSLLMTRKNKAVIATVSPDTKLSKVFTAVTGSAIIVQNGKNTGDINKLNSAGAANPRTAVGLSKNKHYLYLVVIDGRHPGYSIGTTNKETADIMIALGAYTALNLDGGGSTTMVKTDEQDNVVLVNHPSGKTERFDASALGVRARPLSH